MMFIDRLIKTVQNVVYKFSIFILDKDDRFLQEYERYKDILDQIGNKIKLSDLPDNLYNKIWSNHVEID